jgi:hypothetical protein
MRTRLCTFSVGAAIALGAATAVSVAARQASGTCSPESFDRFHKELVAAQNAIQQGDGEPMKRLFSHADDVTLMGALGGHDHGWTQVDAKVTRIAGLTGDSYHDNDQILAKIVGRDLALIVQLEHIVTKNAPPDYLRVTHVARCEGSNWRLVHRHADNLMETSSRAR